MLAVGEGVLLAKADAEFGIGKDADEGLVEFGRIARRSEEYAGIGDRPTGLRTGMGILSFSNRAKQNQAFT